MSIPTWSGTAHPAAAVARHVRRDRPPVPSRAERVVMCVVALALTFASLVHKLSCTTTAALAVPRPVRVTRTACYSDVETLWGRRELGAHLFPYVHGTYSTSPPDVHGGTVEYPTLTGLWVWLSALPASSAPQFLVVTALTFVPAVVVVTLVLAHLAGRRAWVFAATPPLVLYALSNWDLLPVLMTTLGLLVALRGPRSWSPTTRMLVAGAGFGVGGAFKLYPLMFVVPLALACLLDACPSGTGSRVRTAAAAVVGAAAAVLAANVPFVVANAAGWASVFRFQAARPIDATTLSVWAWGLPSRLAADGERAQHLMGLAATGSTALGLVLVLAAGVLLARRRGTVPWVQTAAAMLCVYMVANKVDSLQYVLWLLPFLAVVRVPLGWVAGYLLADLAAFTGWYRSVYHDAVGDGHGAWAHALLLVGVWGRAALLVALVVVFLRSPVVDRTLRGAPAPSLPADEPPEGTQSPGGHAMMDR